MDITHSYQAHHHNSAVNKNDKIYDYNNILQSSLCNFDRRYVYGLSNVGILLSRLWINREGTFGNLGQVRVAVWGRLDWDPHALGGVLALYQEFGRVQKLAMMTDIKSFKMFDCLRRLSTRFLHFFQNILIIQLTGIIPVQINISVPQELCI